jgi:hypothetical protein
MTAPTNHAAIGPLILVRLLAAGEKGESPTKVQKDLEPLLAHRWSGVPMAGMLNQAVEELKEDGLVAFLLGKSRKAAAKVILTAEGRHRALEFLGIATLKPKTTWSVLRKTYLPARALGLPTSTDAQFKAISSDPIFRAILLRRHYNLPTAEVPKPDVAIDALAWKLIGFEGETRKFTPQNVKAAVLNRALDDGRATDFKKAANRLVARDAGARRDDPAELRDAIVRAWIDRESDRAADHRREPSIEAEAASHGPKGGDRPSLSLYAPESPETPVPSEASTRDARPVDLAAFAGRVTDAARACPTGRYGDNKVFIAHVWRMLQSDPDYSWMDLDTFKDRLGLANNARLLDLGRADLVQAMDPDAVRLSEVQYLNATFHFVRI